MINPTCPYCHRAERMYHEPSSAIMSQGNSLPPYNLSTESLRLLRRQVEQQYSVWQGFTLKGPASMYDIEWLTSMLINFMGITEREMENLYRAPQHVIEPPPPKEDGAMPDPTVPESYRYPDTSPVCQQCQMRMVIFTNYDTGILLCVCPLAHTVTMKQRGPTTTLIGIDVVNFYNERVHEVEQKKADGSLDEWRPAL